MLVKPLTRIFCSLCLSVADTHAHTPTISQRQCNNKRLQERPSADMTLYMLYYTIYVFIYLYLYTGELCIVLHAASSTFQDSRVRSCVITTLASSVKRPDVAAVRGRTPVMPVNLNEHI